MNVSAFPPISHLLPVTASISPAGHLHIDGLDAVELVRQYGTPLYAYDAATIRAQIESYQTALSASYPASGEVAYAAKAYLCTALAAFMAQAGLHLDVVSAGELHVALAGGFPPRRIHFHGSNKSPAELQFALQAGVGRIVVDNFFELESLERLAAQRGKAAQIWLRLSPGIDTHTHAYRKTGLLDSKFGFPIATGSAAQAVRRALASPHLDLRGLHAHIGSQIFELDPFTRTIQVLLDFAMEMRTAGLELHEISPGGGLGVPYTADDPIATVPAYVEVVSQALVSGCRARGLALPRLVLEPGRSLVARAGVALYTVGARKEIPGLRTYLSVDGGMADNLRPALYGASYTALLANKAGLPAEETVAVAGKFCESGDILIQEVALPVAEPGDLLAIPVSGAYHLPLSSRYNLAQRPAVLLLNQGQARLIQRRETFADLTSLDLSLDD